MSTAPVASRLPMQQIKLNTELKFCKNAYDEGYKELRAY